ncbi:hypothetical protein ATE84_2925 [Aquimarina sp. MAR_2010_214]|uniref:hypothetical protein n=1 Tax=Aquimarina sp. MAR_2010_214 TaxID=1250026 RepID=UPI000CAAEA57|nr:hypothetical protein [Aquimarina sp. MAR_2010_214]PKV50857.1 hypothetical protein ATE84_2925 [Aquimarina sp. MAR_2010_214]
MRQNEVTLNKRTKQVISLLNNILCNRGQVLSVPVSQPCFEIGSDEQKYPYSLTMHLKGGDVQKSVSYLYLLANNYDRNERIILFYQQMTVNIYGYNMAKLHDFLDKRRVSSISVHDLHSLPLNRGNKKAIITDIQVEYKDKDIEQEIEQMRQHAFSKKGNSGHSR